MSDSNLNLAHFIELAQKLQKPPEEWEVWAKNELKEEEEREKRRRDEEEVREEKRKQADFEREEKKKKDEFDRQERLANRNDRRDGIRPATQKPKVNFAQFNDKEERIDSFLHVFETQARTLAIPVEEWSNYLMPLLSGKSRDVFLELSQDVCSRMEEN